jgi:glycosyltransferase involved in cell wall biosynthesis
MAVDRAQYPPMTAERAAREAGPLRILFVGRLVPEKGPMLLLEALAQLPAGSFEARLVGAGPLQVALAHRIVELGLEHAVSLVGPVGQDQLPAQYAWADAFCLPSFAEGLPVVLMEAMATGLPVVSTRIAGIPELVQDGVCGLLVPAGRVDSLTQALVRLADDPALRSRMGASGVEVVTGGHDAAANSIVLQGLLSTAQTR